MPEPPLALTIHITGNQSPNGTFSGNFITDNGNGSAFFYLNSLGTSKVFYTYTDLNGCTAKDSMNVTIYSNPIINEILTEDVTVCSSPFNGSVTVNASGGSGIFQYSINGNPFIANNIFTGLNVGNYIIAVRDSVGCTVDTTALVGSNTGFNIDSVSVINLNCYGDTNGQVIVYAINAIEYSIDNGITYQSQSVFNNLTAGTYYIIVRNAANCTDLFVISLSSPAELMAQSFVTDAYCGNNNGSANIIAQGGTGSYSYLWSNGLTTSTLNNAPHGNYSVTVTDQQLCSTSLEITVNNNTPFETSISEVVNAACYGDHNGSVTIEAIGTGPFFYNWSNGVTTANNNNLAGGNYSVTISDNLGCSNTEWVTIIEPNEIIVSDSISHVSYAGASNGEIYLSVSGGLLPYSIIWATQPSQNGHVASNLHAGMYSVIVTDNNGCSYSNSYTVNDGINISIEIPSVYSPNNDGVNDDFEIKGIQYYSDIDIEIFNRWGDLIYSHKGTGSNYNSNRWNGKYKGKDLPISSFVYVISINDTNELFKGIVTILR